MIFSIGDKVKCVKDISSALNNHDVYTVVDIFSGPTDHYMVVENNSDQFVTYMWFLSDRFAPYIEPVILPDDLFTL